MGKAYIYTLTNKVNHKVYVGKTNRTVKERYQEHLLAIHKSVNDDRKLYKAFKKYGIENFDLALIEECTTENVEDREMHWIEHYDSYRNGYNMTLGGDGKSYVQEMPVIEMYYQCQNVTETAKRMGIDRETVSNILHANDIEVKSNSDVMRDKFGVNVCQYHKDGKFIQKHNSAMEAAASIGKSNEKSNGAASHIMDVCKGKRKSAYGYIWKFA